MSLYRLSVYHFCHFRTISLRSRIRCIIATTHQVLNNNRLFARFFCLFNVNRDVTTDTTSCVITTIYIFEDATGNGQRHIATHIGIIGTAMNIFYLIARTTRQNHVYITGNVRLITGAIETGNDSWTVWVFFLHRKINSYIATNTLCITAAKHTTDFTALTGNVSQTNDDSTFVFVPAVSLLDMFTTITTTEGIAYEV